VRCREVSEMAEQSSTPITIEVPAVLLKTLDDYRREQSDLLDRAEAILRLLEIALLERWKWQG
jgi:hypothetical protein